MKFLINILPKVLSLILIYYFGYYLYWHINGIQIIRYNGQCNEYKSFEDKSVVIKSDYYIVYGYHHSKDIEKQLDDYACYIADSLFNKYQVVLVTYYKNSRVTNNDYFEKFGDDAHGDYLWHYGFSKADSRVSKTRVAKHYKDIKFYFPKPDCKLMKK